VFLEKWIRLRNSIQIIHKRVVRRRSKHINIPAQNSSTFFAKRNNKTFRQHFALFRHSSYKRLSAICYLHLMHTNHRTQTSTLRFFISLFIYLCIYLFMFLFIYVFIYLFLFIYLCMYLFIYVFMYLFICVCIYVFIYLCFYLFIYVFIYLCTMYLFIYVFIYLFIYLRIHLQRVSVLGPPSDK
jgi:hypothetical protein